MTEVVLTDLELATLGLRRDHAHNETHFPYRLIAELVRGLGYELPPERSLARVHDAVFEIIPCEGVPKGTLLLTDGQPDGKGSALIKNLGES